MTSKTKVVTETYLPRKGDNSRIRTSTSTYAWGNTPHTEQVAGNTAGMIGQGNAMAHADYMKGIANMDIYKKKW